MSDGFTSRELASELGLCIGGQAIRRVIRDMHDEGKIEPVKVMRATTHGYSKRVPGWAYVDAAEIKESEACE